MWEKDPDRISPTLMCDIYAVTLGFWKESSVLRVHPRPDVAFAWNQATSALQDDSLSMTSICSGLLEVSGRPVNQVTTNISTLGRITALSHALGLHRDPSGWNITDAEKRLRTRLWWGVVIHDHWSSFAHGTPPAISEANYDVALPTDSALPVDGSSQSHHHSHASFVYLCSLTQILGAVLPLVYTLQPDWDDMWRKIRRLECSLEEWEQQLPQTFNLPDSGVWNGIPNLRFCYLLVQLLICRVAVRVSFKLSQYGKPVLRLYRSRYELEFNR
jgi:hypothetical protein